MNLTEFLTRVDETVKQLSREELENFVHLRSRTLPESKRNEFIEQLLYAQGKPRACVEEYSIDSIKAELTDTMEKLQKIGTGEIGIDSCYNEEYDDWYDAPSDEFCFQDTAGIGNIVHKACEMLHTAIDYNLSSEALLLSDTQMELDVEIFGDFEDYSGEPMNLIRLYTYGIVSFDLTGWGLDTLYLTYLTEPRNKRPESLYLIFLYFDNEDLSIERMMQRGFDDLEDINEFLADWIKYLVAKQGDLAQRLIKEASELLNDGKSRLDIAEKYCAEHPGLYEQILVDGTGFSPAELLEIGKEALENISENLIIRSRIALRTAEYALKLNNPLFAEECWIEAYRSNTNPINFLRVAVGSKDYESHMDELRAIYNSVLDKRTDEAVFGKNDELCENIIDDNTYYTLLFFGGEFRHMVDTGMNVNYALGWSSTFMKCGIALLLIYLFNGDELFSGCNAMCLQVMDYIRFNKDEYLQGTEGDIADIDRKEMFWSCFDKWKEHTPMDQADREYILKRLDNWISMRVEGIMQENRRRYYGECAAFIAALGEVHESLGVENGKALLMEQYRKTYSRRSAFRAELKRFGMID